MPRKRDRRPEVVALRRVVVDHVEDDLDARLVHGAHHALELLRLLAELAGRRVLVVRREEADGVVAPVVAQPLLEQGRVLHELVHGHELDGGHAELLQVVDDRGVRDAGVRAALLLGDVGMQLGEPLDVRLVDHRLGVGRVRVPVARPVEERVDHDGVHDVRGGVVVVARVGIAELVREERLVPRERARHRLRVRVEEHLARVGIAGRSSGRRSRARGSRTAVRAAPGGGTRARRTRRRPAARRASRCRPRRTGRARRVRPTR